MMMMTMMMILNFRFKFIQNDNNMPDLTTLSDSVTSFILVIIPIN